MTAPQSPREVGGLVRRIQQFGSATEQLFARLYETLSVRRTAETLDQSRNDIEKRNRNLRRLLRTTTLKADRLHAILSSVSEGIILQGLDGRILEINAAAREITGSDRNLWNSEVVSLFAAFTDVTQVGSELAPLGKPRRLTIRGRIVSTQVAAIADHRGTRLGTLIILREETRADLTHRVKASFVTHISHELRTPLAPLRLANEILLAAPTDQPPNRRMLEMIGRNIDILDRMVNEMIDISAMSSGILDLRMQSVLLEDLIMDIYDEFRDEIAEAKQEIQILFRDADSLIVNGDRKYLRWALSNMLRNSVQYSEPGGTIYVRLGMEAHSDTPRIFIELEDQGVGISEDDQAQLFTLFFRGQPRRRDGKLIDPRGLGQGLYVVRTITEAHGGTVSAVSKIGQGSLFTLMLPMSGVPMLAASG